MVCVQVMRFSSLQTQGDKGILLTLTSGIEESLPSCILWQGRMWGRSLLTINE